MYFVGTSRRWKVSCLRSWPSAFLGVSLLHAGKAVAKSNLELIDNGMLGGDILCDARSARLQQTR
jgi:hypothetical protein